MYVMLNKSLRWGNPWRFFLVVEHVAALLFRDPNLCIKDSGGPVLKINDHATGGRRTKDILGGPKGWGPKKKVANAEIYVIFEVFAFCGGRTKTDFKDRAGSVWRRASTSTWVSSPLATSFRPWATRREVRTVTFPTGTQSWPDCCRFVQYNSSWARCAIGDVYRILLHVVDMVWQNDEAHRQHW